MKTNKQAVALRYQPDRDVAPKLIGKGKGYVAEEIIKRAKENNIPIQQDETLVELLSELDINESIPPELYDVVAELFAFLYRIDKESEPYRNDGNS